MIEAEQGKLFNLPVEDPKKIKALANKLYAGVKPVDKLTLKNPNDPKALAMVKKLEKQADQALKGKHVKWNGEDWLVTSVEYSINGGDWWVYAKKDQPYDTENFPIVDLY
jgi:hypothetical protein